MGLMILMVSVTSADNESLQRAKFDHCANDTYSCITGAFNGDNYNHTLGYCCCHLQWENCKRSLRCDSKDKMKGSPESCQYLNNQKTKMSWEVQCGTVCERSGALATAATSGTTVLIMVAVAVLLHYF